MHTTANHALLLFAWLAYVVSAGRAVGLDESVRHAVHSWTEPFLTQVMLAATFVGRDGFMAITGAVFVWRLIKAGRRHEGDFTDRRRGGSRTSSADSQAVVPPSAARTVFRIADPGQLQFPQRPCLTATVFYVLLVSLMTRNPVLRSAAIVLAGLIGLSRIYLGVHYPTDVFAGYAAAIVWLAACQLLRKTFAL